METQATTTTALGIWRYGVRVFGVKNRCRKIEWHLEHGRKGLGETIAFDPYIARALARRWILKNMIRHDKAFATAYFWTVKNGSETWEMMNPDHNISIPL